MTTIDVLLTWPRDGLRLFESMVPIGLASLGTVLRDAGYNVKIVDFNHYRGDFQRDLLRWRPRVVGIGGTTPTRSGSFRAAKLVKKVLPHTVTVYGGAHATFAATDTLTHIGAIDYILKGEAEFSFLALVEGIMKKDSDDLRGISGLCYRRGTEIVENPPVRIDDLSKIPMPARDLFDHDYPLTLDIVNIPADFIMTSRGCPTACDFCSAARMFPGGVRLRPIAAVEAEIEWLLAHKKIEGLKIFDSTFTAVRSHVEEFCRMVSRFNLKWECEIRADSVDEELLRLMHRAGCVYINMGLETTSERLLQTMGKRIRVEQVEEVLAWCRLIGIKTKVFFTFGHIGETFEECLTDIRYMNRIREKIDFFATTVGMRVYPGTTLEIKAKKRGLIPANFSWARFKAPLSNYLILEPADILVLCQPELPIWRLSQIILRLLSQGTVLSVGFIKKMIVENLLGIVAFFELQVRFLSQWSVRRYLKLTGRWGRE